MIKDAADLYQVLGEGAREILHAMSSRAVDALDLVLSEAPKGSTRERYRYAREHVLPLLLKLGDEGEQEAALQDAADALKLGIRPLRNALSGMEQPSVEEKPAEEEPADDRDHHGEDGQAPADHAHQREDPADDRDRAGHAAPDRQLVGTLLARSSGWRPAGGPCEVAAHRTEPYR